MTCREAADFIGDYLSGELPGDTVTVFEDHLQRCPNCRAYLSTYRATLELGRQAFDDEDAPATYHGVPDELIAAILAARRR